MFDRVVMRTLGGISVTDHLTGQAIQSGLKLISRDLVFARTASGVFQIVSAPGFAAYARSFDPVPAVPAASFGFEVHDLTRRFLPVAAQIALPRDASPDAVANRVDEPVIVALPSAGGRMPGAGWTSLRVTVVDQTGAPVRGALVRALQEGSSAELAWGLTDERGSAFLPIIGIPLLREVSLPPDGDDEAELVTAVTRLRLRLTADPARPWPADTAHLRAGGAGLETYDPNDLIDLTSGGAAHRRLTFALT